MWDIGRTAKDVIYLDFQRRPLKLGKPLGDDRVSVAAEPCTTALTKYRPTTSLLLLVDVRDSPPQEMSLSISDCYCLNF